MLPELNQAIEAVQSHLAASKGGFRAGWESFNSADESYKKAAQIRREILQKTLEEKGLAICSDYHFIDKDNQNPSLEQLGIFPKNKMRLLFMKSYSRTQHGHEYMPDTEVGGEVYIHLLCPKHFPENPTSAAEDQFKPRMGKIKEGFSSEIVSKDGKLTLTANGTEIDIKKLKAREPINVIKLNGKEPFDLVGEEAVFIYRHFDIPDLPAKPNFDSVRFAH